MNIRFIERSPFGSIAILWAKSNGDSKIFRIFLSKPGSSAKEQASQLFPHSPLSSCEEIDAVAASIQGILDGNEMEIPLDAADLSLCSPFQRSVLIAEKKIPRGRVSSYRLIAAHIGKPNAARAVGTALARNPFPLIVPCHRAVRSDRYPGGYQGGGEMKRTLLEKEDILFDAHGRVICRRFHYGE